MTQPLVNLSGLDHAGIAQALADYGIPERRIKMRTQQVAHWLYYYGVTDIAEMTNIGKELRAEMADAQTHRVYLR